MDLRRFAWIIRKHWIISSLGLVLACALAMVTYLASPATKYTSTTTLFVTQKGFPFGNTSNASVYQTDLNNLTNLTFLYTQIAQSDQIRLAIGAKPNALSATVVTSGAYGTGNALPFLDITATATSGAGAVRLAAAATRALEKYIAAGEAANNTPSSGRVTLQQINVTPATAVHQRTRVVILPAVVFLTVLLIAIGVLFVLENVREPEPATVGALNGSDTLAAIEQSARRDEAAQRTEARQGGSWRRQ